MKNVFKIAIRVLFLLLFCSAVDAQSLVSTIALNDANLNAAESQRYANLQQDTFTKELKLVNFGNPRDFVNAQGELQFEFPDIQGVIEAQAIDIAQTDSSYSWTGRLLNHAGYFGFYEISGHRAAWLQIDTRFFEIMPIKSSISTVREIEGDVLDFGDCIHPTTEQNTNSELNLCENDYNTCVATIDILVLLPPDATDWLQTRFGNDWFAKALYVGIGTQALNVAFVNSDIPNKKANIILENFSMQYPNGADCGQLLNALVSQATSRRNAVGSDLVVLLTANTDYSCGAGAACAELGDPPNFCDPSFAFTEIWWLFHPRWTFIHEVGHLMGAGHDRPDDNDPDCAHGWTVGDNRFQRTLMARWIGTQNPTDIRILHYSNPDVEYNGDPTGTENDNNAKAIRNGACVVANYRQRYTFDARIDTDPWVCRNWGDIYLFADVQQPSSGNPGIPPYSYDWRWNFSGNFSGGNSTYIGNTQFVSFPVPVTGSNLWVQLKVTSSDGITITKLKNITIYEDDHPKCMWRSQGQGRERKFNPPQKLVLVPNPANSAVQVTWSSDFEGEVVINVTDGLGRLLSSRILSQVQGENIFQINIGILPEGIYNISLRTERSVLSQKLLVNH